MDQENHAGDGQLKICIHRGANQIGGSCVELRSQGHRLLLDVGMPLDQAPGSDVTLPESLDMESSDCIAGVAISHPHADLAEVLAKHTVDPTTLTLRIPQVTNDGVLYDTQDRVQMGTALVRDLLAMKAEAPIEIEAECTEAV